jgi:hypothetical protein
MSAIEIIPGANGGLTGNAGHPPVPPRECALTITVSAAEQDRSRHNLARYNELQKLRLGQPNTYEQTSYR